jgi:copper ion binding protein
MPTVKVKGMSCQHCVASVTKALSELEGVADVKVDLEAGEAKYNEENPVSIDTVKDAIARIGFEVIS